MATFEYVSARGDVLSLNDEKNFKLVNINAQTQAVASIASSILGGSDGDTVNNVQAQPRTLIFDLRIINEVERTKRKILDIIKLKKKGKIVWEQDSKKIEIEGIVEAIDMPRWNNAVIMQITMHCSQPFWQDIDFVVSEISSAIGLHYFTTDGNMLAFPSGGIALGEYDATRTREFHNTGDVAVGMEIEIIAFDTVTNPIIYNEAGDFFGCGHGTGNKQVVMQAGDVIKITTGKDEKAVTLNGTSLLSKIKPHSTWLQLEAGDNQFSISSDDARIDNMTFNLSYKRRYI